MKFSRNMLLSTLAAAVIVVCPAGIALSQAPALQGKKAASTRPEPMIHQMIVKLRNPTAAEKVSALGSARVSALSKSAGVQLKGFRAMSGDASVLSLDAPMSLADARALAARLAADPTVEYAEPDMPVRRLQVTPPDLSFAGRQWNFQIPGTMFNSTINLMIGGTKQFTNTGGANFQNAWTTTTGVNTVVVAVLDSGVTLDHTDLTAALIPGAGYDFIINPFVANDGDGRDADATDPGDWVDAAAVAASGGLCDAMDIGNSSWHGTHMSGVVAAAWGGTTPGTSTAGGAPNIRILPVRVLGRCGGVGSDVIDGMRWAAGLAVPGVPNNPNPAKVLNLSLGGGTCAAGSLYQNAVTEIVNAGVVIVAASGNEGIATVSTPANCVGVIGVTAHVINGENADYSNIGPQVAISAPGGGEGTTLLVPNLLSSDSANWIWSTSLFGATTPTSPLSGTDPRSGPAIVGFTGTSPATPHVAATAALLLSLSPALSPATVRSLITSPAAVRPHPVGGFCLSAMGMGNCGAGLLDAGAAITLHQIRRPTISAPTQNANGATNVVLAVTPTGNSGSSTFTYAWTQTSGATVTLSSSTAASPSFTAPNVTGNLVFQVAVTDGNGYRNTASKIVSVTGVVPTITTQPQNVTVISGQPASFSATVSGPAPITYQWQRNGTNIVGAINTGYSIAATAASDNGAQFRVVATNSAGSVTSNAALLTVNAPPNTAPAITTQPQNVTVAAGQPAQFSVAASGSTPMTFNWRRDGLAIAGATSSTLTLTTTTAGDNGARFSVVVSNAVGSSISADAILTVTSAPSGGGGGGGGGGSLPLWNLLLIAAFAIAAGLRRRA